MLQRIREWISGWISIVIVALLIVPFAFWGINYYFDQGGELTVASIDDTDITQRDFQRALQNVRQRWQAAGGGALSTEEQELLKKQTVEGIIERELLEHAVRRMGLRVSDAQLRSFIESINAFHGVDGFDPVVYEAQLSAQGQTRARFERALREEMASEQLQGAVVDAVVLTDAEVRALARLYGQSRDFWYAILPSDPVKEAIIVEDAEVADYYEQHASEYMTPEQVRIAYVELSVDRMAGEVTVSEEDLRGYYEEHRSSFGLEEQREVFQILVPAPEDADAEAVAAAEKIAAQLAGQLKNTPDMQALVQATDPDGELGLEYAEFGFLQRGILEPEVEKAVFEMAPGNAAAPVRSKYGFHVLRIGVVKGGTIEPYEQVRATVEQEYRKSEAAKRFSDIADQLATLAFENPDTLETAAEALDLSIQESPWFSRETPGSGVTAAPRVLEAAFSEEALEKRENSDIIELDDGRAVVLRVIEHVPRQAQALDEVRERIVSRIKFERAGAKLRETGAEILQKLRAGAPRDAISADYSVQWQEAHDAGMDDPGIGRAVLREAFRTPRPPEGQQAFSGISLGNGDYALIAVERVTDPPADSLAKEELDRVRDELRGHRAEESWSVLMADLRNRADVQIYEENLD